MISLQGNTLVFVQISVWIHTQLNSQQNQTFLHDRYSFWYRYANTCWFNLWRFSVVFRGGRVQSGTTGLGCRRKKPRWNIFVDLQPSTVGPDLTPRHRFFKTVTNIVEHFMQGPVAAQSNLKNSSSLSLKQTNYPKKFNKVFKKDPTPSLHWRHSEPDPPHSGRCDLESLPKHTTVHLLFLCKVILW